MRAELPEKMKNDFLTFDDARQLAGPTAFGTMLKPVGTSCNLRCNYCYYLDKQDFLVGISLDGPQEIHDTCRRNAGGTPTHHRVMESIRLFQEYGVEFNTLSVIRQGCEDQGYGDVGCYGQSLIRTPELDRIARSQHTHSNDFKVTLP